MTYLIESPALSTCGGENGFTSLSGLVYTKMDS